MSLNFFTTETCLAVYVYFFLKVRLGSHVLWVHCQGQRSLLPKYDLATY